MQSSKDIFEKWAAMPEWEKNYRRFYAPAPESAYKALKIAFLITAISSWPFKGWRKKVSQRCAIGRRRRCASQAQGGAEPFPAFW